MSKENKKIKTKRPKRQKTFYEMSIYEKIATKCGCSTRYVQLVLDGNRQDKTKLAQEIIASLTQLIENDQEFLGSAISKAAEALVPIENSGYGDSKIIIE